MKLYKLPYDPVTQEAECKQWLCDLVEDTYSLVSEPLHMRIVDEDSHRLTVYYGPMPIGWISGDSFMFGVIFNAVAQGDMPHVTINDLLRGMS